MAERKKVEFQLYSSMTKQKEVFRPKEEGQVGMYVCGVTAYDYSHIGHARAYVAFDVLYRLDCIVFFLKIFMIFLGKCYMKLGVF